MSNNTHLAEISITKAMEVIYTALQGYEDLTVSVGRELDDERWDAINLAMASIQKELTQSDKG